jgi:hypothetical protein
MLSLHFPLWFNEDITTIQAYLPAGILKTWRSQPFILSRLLNVRAFAAAGRRIERPITSTIESALES